MTRADPALAYPLTIYYDASCPLCRAELETLSQRDAESLLQLVDCSAGDIALEGVTNDDMMARIHARDAAGRWLRGMDVFAAVYRAAGLFLLARIYRGPQSASAVRSPVPVDRGSSATALAHRIAARVPPRRPGARACDACARPPPSPPR